MSLFSVCCQQSELFLIMLLYKGLKTEESEPFSFKHMDCGRVSSNTLRNMHGFSSFLTQSHVTKMIHCKTIRC